MSSFSILELKLKNVQQIIAIGKLNEAAVHQSFIYLWKKRQHSYWPIIRKYHFIPKFKYWYNIGPFEFTRKYTCVKR